MAGAAAGQRAAARCCLGCDNASWHFAGCYRCPGRRLPNHVWHRLLWHAEVMLGRFEPNFIRCTCLRAHFKQAKHTTRHATTCSSIATQVMMSFTPAGDMGKLAVHKGYAQVPTKNQVCIKRISVIA